MKKIMSMFAVLFLLIMSVPAAAFADSMKTDEKWGVTFTKDNELVSNFETEKFNDAIYGLQPGDDVTITLKLINGNQETADFYMLNRVVQSLEDASKTAGGAAYTYILTYKGVDGSTEDLFRSDTVGGAHGENKYYVKDLEGLHGATDNLKDYFYLDTFEPGQQGLVTLQVALDGETHGNDYQDTLAELMMKFAVEVTSGEPGEPTNPPKNTTVVITGEEVHPMPLFITMGFSGLMLLLLVIIGIRYRKAEKEAV